MQEQIEVAQALSICHIPETPPELTVEPSPARRTANRSALDSDSHFPPLMHHRQTQGGLTCVSCFGCNAPISTMFNLFCLPEPRLTPTSLPSPATGLWARELAWRLVEEKVSSQFDDSSGMTVFVMLSYCNFRIGDVDKVPSVKRVSIAHIVSFLHSWAAVYIDRKEIGWSFLCMLTLLVTLG